MYASRYEPLTEYIAGALRAARPFVASGDAVRLSAVVSSRAEARPGRVLERLDFCWDEPGSFAGSGWGADADAARDRVEAARSCIVRLQRLRLGKLPAETRFALNLEVRRDAPAGSQWILAAPPRVDGAVRGVGVEALSEGGSAGAGPSAGVGGEDADRGAPVVAPVAVHPLIEVPGPTASRFAAVRVLSGVGDGG